MLRDNRWAKLLVGGLLLTAFVISLLTLVPIAQGYGASLSYGDGANMDALTQLTQAREGLYSTLPNVLAQGGSAAVQMAMAIVAVILGLAVGSVIFAISFNLIVRGYVGAIQTKNSVDAGLLPKIRTIPRNEPRLYGRGSNIGGLISDFGSEESGTKRRVCKSGRNTDGANGSSHPITDSINDLSTLSGVFSSRTEFAGDPDIE